MLQAITRLPFPVQDTLCTRFATEVSLRRAPGPDVDALQRQAARFLDLSLKVRP